MQNALNGLTSRRSKVNCSNAKEFARRQYIRTPDATINLTIEGDDQTPDGSFTIEFTNFVTIEIPRMQVKNVSEGFKGNNYYLEFK